MSTSDQLGNDADRIRRDAEREWEGGRLPLGLILLSIGAIFTAERLGYLEIEQVWRYWPLFFVVMAVSSVARRQEGAFRGAFSFLFMAAIFFMHNFDIIRIQYSWPLFIVLAGINIVWGALTGRACRGTRT